nr:MAG TPA: hypothetical protein [Caudoviricetes sp.]
MNCFHFGISPTNKNNPASGANTSGAKQSSRRAQPVGYYE